MKKTLFNLTATSFLAVLICTDGFGQNVSTSPTPVSSQIQTTDTSRERREQAYAKLLEGQRYIWQMNPRRSSGSQEILARQAKAAFQKAVELDPNLAEAYTALAQLSMGPNGNLEDAVMLAGIAAKINPDNFGARRILARLYTIKSRLNSGTLEPNSTQKAVAEWREVARLDPRNAEAWAFLSEYYRRDGKENERITALKNWLSSSSSLEPYFYRTVMGNGEELSTENATVKLGAAYVKANRLREAVEILSNAVADQPENTDAVDLLREALEGTDGETASKAVQFLQQAVFANPRNLVLVELLAETQARSGKTDEAAKTVRDAVANISETDKNQASGLLLILGDIYAEAERTNDAISTYNESLKMSGIDKTPLINEAESEFAGQVFGRMISAYKYANRYAEAKALIDRSRLILSKEDNFPDRQLINLLLETGKRAEALQILRSVRIKFPTDETLIRQEAMLLTESGKVDEAVILVKNLLKGKSSSAPSILQTDFNNLLFISSLYNQAKRGKDAIATANEAYTLARNDETKQIAKLSLATAQNTSGDFASAEKTLSEILKMNPGNPFALNNLGYFLLERNERLDEAIKLIKQAVKIDPTNPNYLDSLGWAYFKQKNYTEAEKHLRDAARRSSDSSTVYEHLGDVYQAQGKADQAKTAWQKALNLATDAEEISRIKGKLVKKSGK